MVPRPNITTLHKAAAFAAQKVPRSIASAIVTSGAMAASLLAGDRRVIVERNLERALGRQLSVTEARKAVARTFSAYGRYYLDSFRLPALDAKAIDDGFGYTGFEHIKNAVDSGVGPILVLPHLGGWEWAAFWLTQVQDLKVTAIVEPLDPPELFDWFRSFRESLGMTVVPVGPAAGPAVLEAINSGEVVCLLSDRVVADAAAVPVEFFGERTLLPSGPATLSLRTGAPLIPVAVYFDGHKHMAECRPPVPAIREGNFRADVQRVTQLLADELERFIRAAPEQWHVLQPGWPSDYRALGRPVPDRLKDLA
ncbi:MAG: lauroyl/myristoyl acyltransferase [Verrucomicrobiales bacterium]|jgi:lauroyl/myristoyl acyltransferase